MIRIKMRIDGTYVSAVSRTKTIAYAWLDNHNAFDWALWDETGRFESTDQNDKILNQAPERGEFLFG